MTRLDLENALEGNSGRGGQISMKEMSNITPFVNVSLEIDRGTLEYYYQIDIEELLKSKMPKDELEAIKSQGWKISNSNRKLILFLT